jgi:O-antigen/teichoic acid export membrane protein
MTEVPPKISPTRIKIATNTASQMIGRLITGSSTFIISLLIARMYGASGYGDFTKITTFVAVFYLFADFGLNAVYLRDKKNNLDNDIDWQTLFTLRIILSLMFMFLTCIILIFIPTGISSGYTNSVKIGIILFAPSILFQSIIVSINAIFQEKLRYDLATLAAGIGSVVSLALVWFVTLIYVPNIAVSASLISLVIGLFATTIIGSLIIKKYVKFGLAFDSKKLYKLLFTSVPLGATLILNVIYFRADSFILTFTRSTPEVGIYGLAYKIFEYPLAIPTFFMNAIYPLLLNRLSLNQQLISKNVMALIKNAGWLLLLSSICVCVLFWYMAPLVVYIKPEFSLSITPLRILTVGLPFFFLSSLTMWILVSLKKQTALMLIYGISMALNVLANLWLTPKYGYIAASIITVVSEALILSISLVYIHQIVNQHSKILTNN